MGDRRHFFGAAANAMGNILVEHSRRKATEKHGGKLQRIELHDDLALELPAADHLLALHESLKRLQGIAEIYARSKCAFALVGSWC